MKRTINKVDPLALVSRYAFFLILGWFIVGARVSSAQSAVSTPVITTQPVSYVADYGSVASFSVEAAGTVPLSFQWQRNGLNLFDFDNVSGSRTATLNLAGVAGNEVGNYRVVVSYPGGGAVTSAIAVLSINPTTIFSDNFESGSGKWNALLKPSSLPGGDGLSVSAQENHTGGGAWSLAMSNATQKVYHNLPVQYACRVKYSFWFYDDGSAETSGGGELRGYSGVGYAKYISPGGLRQTLAMGKVNAPFPSGNTGNLAKESLDSGKYQGRVLHGTNTGWFNLNAVRSPGWHKFTIDRAAGAAVSGGQVDFYVDDVLARTVKGATMAPVDSVFLGSLDIGEGKGSAFFDDVSVEAYPGLFDWQNLASDGLIPDWMQFRETGTSRQVVSVYSSTVYSQYGATTNGSLGDWAIDGSAVYATGLRGYVDYSVKTTVDGAYRIEVEGRERHYRMPRVDMPVEVSVDGEYLGRMNLAYGEQANGLLHCITPFIRAGSHTLRLYWDNADPRRSLHIEGIRLQALVSGSQTNGLATWMVNRLFAQNGIEVCPATSLVSPVCVEGRGQYLSMMSLVAGAQGQFSPVPVQHGAGYRWYANVPLSASKTTTLLASYQNGGLTENSEITWQACNLLFETNSLTIRQGDSLLLTAVPDPATAGEVQVLISNGASFATDALAPAPYQFNQAGTFTVTGTYTPTGASGTITVTVVSASFEDSPIARVFHARYWDCTNLPPQVVLDADPRLKLVAVSDEERAAQTTPAMPPREVNEHEFRVFTRSTEPEYILARLGTNGPVIAGTPVRGFRWSIAPETYLRMIAVNPDRSQLIETAFVAGPIFPSLSVGVQIISSGVTFDDGTVTRKILAKDFDETGTLRLRFIRSAEAAGSTCHTTQLYDNETMIGWR